jgi:hypothetical protein
MSVELNFEAEPFAFESYAEEGELEAPGTSAVTPHSVIDSRIDVHAQYALQRLSKGDAGARAEAAGMLAEVKAGRLGGIYKEDQQVPALRAKRMGKGWWEVIPKAEDAALFLETPNPAALPLIVFRDRVRSDAARLDPALRKAFASYSLLRGGGLKPCGATPSAARFRGAKPAASIPASNVFPPGLCRTASCPRPAESDPAFARWLAQALTSVLGAVADTRLAPVQTRSTLRSFQERHGLSPTGRVDRATQLALTAASGIPAPCQLGGGEEIACVESLTCPTLTPPDPSRVFACTVKAKGLTFDFCWTTLAFNPTDRGEIDPIPRASPTRLIFSCHRSNVASKPCSKIQTLCIPAWEYEAAVIASGPRLKASDWEVGFLQTVRSSRWAGIYNKGVGNVCDMSDTLDELGAAGASRSPWVMPTAVTSLCDGSPKMTDTPRAIFPINHSSGGRLLQVCFTGTFDLWLAAKLKKDAPKVGNFVLLGFKQIKVERMWRRDPGDDPTSPTAWLRFGGQRETQQKCGPSSLPVPVVDGQTANAKQAACFRIMPGATCADPPDGSPDSIGGECTMGPC